MSDLPKQIAELFARENLVKPRQKMLVGVSGGLDSMVLLHLLHELATTRRWQLGVVHVNHGLRGRASNADERFVRKAAERLGRPFFTEKHDVRARAESRGISLEMAARQARHEAIIRAAKTWRCRKLALAHHLDDQVELFFLRLFRGAGARGLGGMRLAAPFASDSRITVLRPLLGFKRASLTSFAQENRIRFREDSSNQDESIPRNRVRHRLLPLLESEFQPALREVVTRSMALLRDTDEAAEEAIRLGFERKFRSLPEAIQRRLVFDQLLQLGIEPDFELVNRLLTSPTIPVTGPGEVRLRLDRDGQIARLGERAEFQIGETTIPVATVTGQFDDLNFESRLLKSKPRRLNGRLDYFDADKIGQQLRLRHWQPGDRFRPLGMPKPVKLQDLFVNAKIPRDQRRKLVVMESLAGEIIWVEKLRIGEPAKIRPETARFWRWRCQRQGFE